MIQFGYNVLTEKPVIADLEQMGHVCIVGGTGSGKSVGTLYFLYNLLKNYVELRVKLLLMVIEILYL